MKLSSIFLLLGLMLGATSVVATPVPLEVKSTVAFIFIEDGSGGLKPNGTGFFVGVKNPQKEGSFAVYFVTAKHVLQKNDDKSWYPRVFLRVNKKDGTAQTGELILIRPEGSLVAFAPDDPTVDLAIIPFFPDPERFDIMFLPQEVISP
jgi:hypothetical protein